MRFAEVVVTLPVHGRFHYAIPDGLELEVGHRVRVPFGPRQVTGFVLGFSDTAPEGFAGKIRPIGDRLDVEPLLSTDLLAIVKFAADYYLAPQGDVLKAALPPGLTATSAVFLKITEAGEAALTNGEAAPALRELLERAKKPAGLKRTSKVRKDALRLERLGWVSQHDRFSAKAPDLGVEVVSRTDGDEGLIARAPAKKKLYEAIGTDTPVGELLERFGAASARRALRGLESDGLITKRRVHRDELAAHTIRAATVELSTAQRDALDAIVTALKGGEPAGFLLRGVTGSGKTEVYMHAIAEARRMGRGAIVLVPEIALTSQLEARFSERFGDDVVVLHSAMTDKARRTRWDRLHRGLAHIALGPRSAVWAPIDRPAIVVVDEEHDTSFKQHSDLRYNGRDLALLRANRAGGIAILGSATPSLESRQLAKTGRLTELRLASRIGERPMPKVKLIDLTTAPRDLNGELPLISADMSDALFEVVNRGEQAILFLNRRGFNTVVVCDDCGESRKCNDCDVALTHHKSRGELVCHYCGHTEGLVAKCKACDCTSMKPYGAGTERIAAAVKDAVPDARVLRLDRDITSRVGALEETLDAFREGRADVLVGTQMVTKGHDFPNVTLVGILCADSSLAFPDFRAAERTFQLMTQVAGRAGRAEKPGRVIVQAFQPDHYSLTCAMTHDDDRFFELELASRRGAGYPPFARMGIVRIESEDEEACVARDIANLAREATKGGAGRVRGPSAAPIERIRNRLRRMVMILAPTPASLVQAMRTVQTRLEPPPARVMVLFDVDAFDLL